MRSQTAPNYSSQSVLSSVISSYRQRLFSENKESDDKTARIARELLALLLCSSREKEDEHVCAKEKKIRNRSDS